MLKTILISICLSLPLAAQLQEASGGTEYTLYNETQQLNGSSINDIRRDRYGFFWLATERGLIRFDGRNFIEVQPTEGTPVRREIVKLNLQGDSLWLMYRSQGCQILNIRNLQFHKVSDAPLDDATGIAGGGMFLLMEDGSIVKSRAGRIIAARRYTRPKKGLLLYHLDRLFVSLPGTGAFELDTADLSVRRRLPWDPEAYKESFSIIGEDVFFVTNGRAMRLDSTLTLVQDPNFGKILGKQVSAVTGTGHAMRFIICNNNQLVEQRNGAFRRIPLPGLENFEFRNLWAVDSANILMGTNQGLVHVRLQRHPSDNIQEKGDDSDGELRIRRKILEQPDGTLILMGSPLTFVHRPATGLGRLMSYRFSAYDATFAGRDMFVATEGLGLVRIRPGAQAIDMLNIDARMPKAFYLSVWYDSLERRLMVGGQQTLVSYWPETGRSKILPVMPKAGMVRVIRQDRAHRRYWIGTDNGMFIMDSSLKIISTFRRGPGGLRGGLVGDLLQRQHRNEMWVGHDHGVDIVDINSLRIIRHIPDSVFINPRVVSMAEDGQGRIWMGTYSGIIGYEPVSGQFHRLGRGNGLINTEYNYKAALRMNDGRLIFGGLNGYDIIDPSRLPFSSGQKKGMVTGIHRFKGQDTIFQAVNTPPGRISFDTQNEYLRIYVSSPDILGAAAQTYEYNIDGDQWITLNGAAHINILRLDPGEYTLNIRAFDAFGSQVRFDPVRISATVPFLKSRLFLIILICFAVLFMTLFILSSVRAKNRELQLKERIAMDLHDEVGTMLTRALYVARTDERTASHTHLIQSLNESLFSLRAHINTMNHASFSFAALADDVKEMTQSLLGMTNCRGLVEEKTDEPYRINGALCRDIRLCLYEIINNTLKHSGADTLKIYMTAHKHVLTVFTRDNGRLRSVKDIGTQGNGMRNLGKRVTRHNGQIEFGIPRAGHGLTVRMRFDI
ncbi:MAG: hypothetical protein LW694_07595 [Chitinophagaceae bacterium]|nr:hypothetical protein [Chitinophagaceae bacterium]